MRPEKRSVDAFVIGGGPAGLAAAIALRCAGMSVIVADFAPPPIDKSCGEGLMPDGVVALQHLGVDIAESHGRAFRGIAFRAGAGSVSVDFTRGHGIGIRRTALHNLMVERARSLGVQMIWDVHAEMKAHGRVFAGGQQWRAGLIVGADGQHSRVRQVARLDRPAQSLRYGFRQHFRIAPWTDCVEVTWAREGQATVTATGEDEVCVAMTMESKSTRMADLPRIFPHLGERLAGCRPTSAERGATIAMRRLPRVMREGVALIGEAAGSVDAVTGEGLTIALQQAVALGRAIEWRRPDLYEWRNRQLMRIPLAMSRAMVFLGRHPRLALRFVRASERDSTLFSRLVSMHIGAEPSRSLSPMHLTAFGWKMLAA